MSKFKGDTDCFLCVNLHEVSSNESMLMESVPWLCWLFTIITVAQIFVVDRVVWGRFSSKYFDVACHYLSASAA